MDFEIDFDRLPHHYWNKRRQAVYPVDQKS